MKKYEPKELVHISRYQNYFPTLSAEIQNGIYARMRELIDEEKEYCDKGNYNHMAQILTSIVMYEVLQKHGKSEEEAYKIVSEEMWKFLDPSGMQKLAKKRFFLPLMKKIVPLGFKMAPESAGATPGIRMTRRMNFTLNAMSVFTPKFSGSAAF